MKCLVCKKNEAVVHHSYGIIPCDACRSKQKHKVSKQVEFTTDSIREQRKQYKDHLIQPFRKGILSKEYIELHGTKGITVSKDEVKKAKYVWQDEQYYS